MASRKPLKPVNQSFLDGAPVTTAQAPKPKRVRQVVEDTSLFQMRITLPTPEDHPVQPVSLKIPYKLYKDISEIRERTKGALTLTEIFVKSAEPEVAELLRQLREKEAAKP